jgi:hypothetical protein
MTTLDPNRFKALHPDIYNLLCEAMAKHDMAGLMGFGCPPDEYSPEVDELIYRLDEIDKISTLGKILLQIFIKMFTRRIAGTADAYIPLASDLFAILKTSGVLR